MLLAVGLTEIIIDIILDTTAALKLIKVKLLVAVKPFLVKRDTFGTESPLLKNLTEVVKNTRLLTLLIITRLH